MNSRRRISAPKLRGQHCIGSNERFDRGSKPASKPLPQCTANVADGSKARITAPQHCRLLRLNEQTFPGDRECMFMLGPRHASHSAPHRPVIPGLSGLGGLHRERRWSRRGAHIRGSAQPARAAVVLGDLDLRQHGITSGRAASLDEAKAQFLASWEKCRTNPPELA